MYYKLERTTRLVENERYMDQTHILVGPEEKPKKSPVQKTTERIKSSLIQYRLILAASAVIFIVSVIIGFTYKSRQISQKISQDDLNSPSLAEHMGSITQTDETINWKTYTNNLYKYTLKYPVDEKLQNIDCSNSPNPRDKNKFILGISNQTDCVGQGENYIITIETEGGLQECQSTSSWDVEEDKAQVGNQQATKCTYKFIGQRALPGPEAYIQVNFSYEEIFFSAYLKDLNYLNSFNQILSTFKFLDNQ